MHKYIVIFIALFVIVLPACGSQPSPIAEVATIDPNSIVITIQADTKGVLPGQTVAIALEASGQNLRFKWSAARGTLSTTDMPAVTYTAPDTPGVDTVSVEVSNDAGTVVKSVVFEILSLAPPATSTPSPTLTPAVPFDFGLSIQPDTQRVTQGQSTRYTIQVTSTQGIPLSVTIGVEDLPESIAWALSHPSLIPNGEVTLSITTTSNTPSGAYAFRVTGTDGKKDHDQSIALTVLADICRPVAGANYSSLPINGPPTDRPAAEHGDINLALRGYQLTQATLEVVDYPGDTDPNAPQLADIFDPQRQPIFPAVYRVNHWNWDCNCRGNPIDDWPVTLVAIQASPGEAIHVPRAGYDIGNGNSALVLYASQERITLKYTREDNVIHGYTVHIENVCVDPNLLALYQRLNAAGRQELPALRSGQAFGRARSDYVGVTIRESAAFMDPRTRKDWWRGY